MTAPSKRSGNAANPAHCRQPDRPGIDRALAGLMTLDRMPVRVERSANDTYKFDRMVRLDPYRAANLVIQQHGTGAKAYAVQRMQDMRAAGDEPGEWA